MTKLRVEGEGEVVSVCGFKQVRHASVRFTSHDAGFETVCKRRIREGWRFEWGASNSFSSFKMPMSNHKIVAISILPGIYIGRKLRCSLSELLPNYGYSTRST